MSNGVIKIELCWAVSLYLIFSVIGILVIWFLLERKKTLRGIGPEEKFVWQCSICTYFYVDSQNDEFSICPRCGSYNTRITADEKERGLPRINLCQKGGGKA